MRARERERGESRGTSKRFDVQRILPFRVLSFFTFPICPPFLGLSSPYVGRPEWFCGLRPTPKEINNRRFCLKFKLRKYIYRKVFFSFLKYKHFSYNVINYLIGTRTRDPSLSYIMHFFKY